MLGTRGSHLAKKWKFYLKNISMKFLDKCDREIRLFTFSKFYFSSHFIPQDFSKLKFFFFFEPTV